MSERFQKGRVLLLAALGALIVGAAGGPDDGVCASMPPCVPHTCSKLALDVESRWAHLSALKLELDNLPVSSPLDCSRSDVPALLITVGGPERAESIVQAHVLMDNVRIHDTLPIEVLSNETRHHRVVAIPFSATVGVACRGARDERSMRSMVEAVSSF
jgi:hypothetical protein